MSKVECNYQRKVTIEELSLALGEAKCHQCGVTTNELMKSGEVLEVCGEEFSSDPVTGDRVMTAVALCPSCHRRHHQDARGKLLPCQVRARRSREGLL